MFAAVPRLRLLGGSHLNSLAGTPGKPAAHLFESNFPLSLPESPLGQTRAAHVPCPTSISLPYGAFASAVTPAPRTRLFILQDSMRSSSPITFSRKLSVPLCAPCPLGRQVILFFSPLSAH